MAFVLPETALYQQTQLSSSPPVSLHFTETFLLSELIQYFFFFCRISLSNSASPSVFPVSLLLSGETHFYHWACFCINDDIHGKWYWIRYKKWFSWAKVWMENLTGLLSIFHSHEDSWWLHSLETSIHQSIYWSSHLPNLFTASVIPSLKVLDPVEIKLDLLNLAHW